MPSPATSDIEIAQRGLTLVGVTPFDTWETDSDDCRMVKAFYEDLVRSELGAHPWKFCNSDVIIYRLAAEPLWGFSAAYQLPADPPILSIKAVRIGDQPQHWRVSQDKIYVDANETDLVVLTAQFRQPVNLWPPHFILFMEARIAGWAAASITRNAGLAQMWFQEASLLMIKARNTDAKQQTVERLPIGRFTAVRRGGRS